MSDAFMPVEVFVRHGGHFFIGGAWVEPASGKRLTIISPDTEQPIARVAEAIEPDMDHAVDAARRAFDAGPWPLMAPSDRAASLRRLGAALKRREPELARAWTAQVGGLASLAPFMVAGGTMALDGAAALIEQFEFETSVPSSVADAALIRREPVGVVAAIAPWNAPYSIMLGKVAQALAAGCCVIMKPAPQTPLEAYIIAEAAAEVGLPAGVLNLVCGDSAASDHLVAHPGVDKVSFTGSSATGARIGAVCGGRIARCTLELGGKSAAIVRDDFPIDDAARLLAGTITLFSGQICAMLSRVIVSKRRHDQLADSIARALREITTGHSDDPSATMGPLAMARQRDRVEHYIDAGVKQGADLILGGGRPAHLERGFFIEPTLFANVQPDAAIAQEEIFGPVLSLIPCEDEDDAIRIANDSHYGLHGSVLTHDCAAALRIARRVRTGCMAQNGMKLDFSLPFGGFKQSGIGREGGAEGLLSYLETKTILLDAPASLAPGRAR